MIVITFPASSVSKSPSGSFEEEVSILISWLALDASLPAISTKDTFVGYVLSANVSFTSILHVPAVTVP